MKGSTTVDGYDMYFHLGTGRQAKGELVDIKGKVYYFDKDNGRKVKDTTFDFDGKTYVADQSGVLSIKSQSTERNRYISDSEGTGTMSMARATSSLVLRPSIMLRFTLIKMVNKQKVLLLMMVITMTRILVNLLT